MILRNASSEPNYESAYRCPRLGLDSRSPYLLKKKKVRENKERKGPRQKKKEEAKYE